jgi:hypothetical protein
MNKEAMKRWVEVFDGNWHDEPVDSEWADRAHQALAEMRQAIAEAEQPALMDEVARLNKALTWEQNRAERIGTHGPGCHLWGDRHYECLLRKFNEENK